MKVKKCSYRQAKHSFGIFGQKTNYTGNGWSKYKKLSNFSKKLVAYTIWGQNDTTKKMG